MPGDEWQKHANLLRIVHIYVRTSWGINCFMGGGEFGQTHNGILVKV